jgi:hypothetical protein
MIGAARLPAFITGNAGTWSGPALAPDSDMKMT